MHKIISLPVDDGGCGWYRVRQPLGELNRLPDWNTHVINPHLDDMTATADAIRVADVLIARAGSEVGVKKLLDEKEYKGKAWVMDIDDNLMEISPYSPHYEDFGKTEYYDKGTKQWIWKEGENFNTERNRQRREWHEWGLRNATMVTTSTERLAEFARQYNKNVVVLPNCINHKVWWQPNYAPRKTLRVGWSGGISHYEDWYSIKEPLNKLMKELQFTLVMVGSKFDGIIDEENRHLVEYHDWVHFTGHSYRMMTMDLDLAIIPLADLPFNYYKSDIKYAEFSAMGIPTVVSWVPPYRDTLKKELCYGYTNPKEFREAVLEALQNKTASKKVGERAKEWVKETKDCQKEIQQWVKAYSSIS